MSELIELIKEIESLRSKMIKIKEGKYQLAVTAGCVVYYYNI